MITAKEMCKIATEYHDIIDDDFISNTYESIKNNAAMGGFYLEFNIMEVNNSTRNKLVSTLRNNGFKVELDILQSCATVSWNN